MMQYFAGTLDGTSACGMLGRMLAGMENVPDPSALDICKGISIHLNGDTHYDPSDVADQMRECLFDGLKGAALGPLLEGVKDPVERKALKTILDKAHPPKDNNPTLSLQVNGAAKCVNGKVSLTLKYKTQLTIGG